MIWARPLLIVGCLQGCGIYSFSSSSISKDAKTFSIRFGSEVARGPAHLATQFQEKLATEILQHTHLKQTSALGDIRFDGDIVEFDYAPAAPSSSTPEHRATITRLTIKVKLNYTNTVDSKTSFQKREFSDYADAGAKESIIDAESRLVEEASAKIIRDICSASIDNW